MEPVEWQDAWEKGVRNAFDQGNGPSEKIVQNDTKWGSNTSPVISLQCKSNFWRIGGTDFEVWGGYMCSKLEDKFWKI